jgi:hypothetical protein
VHTSQILYEDNHLLIVDKPADWVVQGAREDQRSLLESARTYIKQKYQKPGNVFLGVVSRLDAPVTGVVPLARTSKAAARLSEQFRWEEPSRDQIDYRAKASGPMSAVGSGLSDSRRSSLWGKRTVPQWDRVALPKHDSGPPDVGKTDFGRCAPTDLLAGLGQARGLAITQITCRSTGKSSGRQGLPSSIRTAKSEMRTERCVDGLRTCRTMQTQRLSGPRGAPQGT